MKKFLIFIPTLCVLSSCIVFDNPSHEEAKKQFIEHGTVSKNSQGETYYYFTQRYAETNDYYGDNVFLYFKDRDVFRLYCCFNSFYNENERTDGAVYADFKWKEYSKATHYFSLKQHYTKANNDELICSIQYFDVTIDGDSLTGKFSATTTFSSEDEKTTANGFELIKRAFEYGKQIFKAFSLDSFY